MRYLLTIAVLALASCSSPTAPAADRPSFDSGNSCNGPEAKAACAGYNPSKHNP